MRRSIFPKPDSKFNIGDTQGHVLIIFRGDELSLNMASESIL